MDLTDVTAFLGRPLEYPLAFAPVMFILGALIGSLLNVCIYRMPLEKSLWWPGSRCSNCYQPVRKLDNLPIFSYWILGGRCRTCGVKFSSRYFYIELFTAAMFAALFWYYVGYLPNNDPLFKGVSKFQMLGMWAYHITFLCFLLVAAFTDIDHREIPLRLTVPGTVIGILFGAMGGWPWPVPIDRIGPSLEGGMQYWPFWPLHDAYLPLLGPFEPNSWKVGLLTSLIGALVGTSIIRVIRFLFSWAYEREAMGLGDADLLMLIGAFLGWQALVLVMGYAVILALIVVLAMFLFKGTADELWFGPPLAVGAVLVLFDNLTTIRLHDLTRGFFFNSFYVAVAAFVFLFLCFNACLVIRLLRVAFRPVKAA